MASGLLGSASLNLPNELVLVVIGYLADDNATLCTLARTCRGLQHLAEEQIYKTIELLSVKDLGAIIEAFTYRHDRVRAVQTLKILYRYRPDDLQKCEEARTTFNECVAHMINLREWHVESPFDNFKWEEAGGQGWVERDMVRFRCAFEAACVDGPAEAEQIVAERKLGNVMDRTVGLALLESLTIHSHGANEDFWALDGFECLFRHPNLRQLHVSCVSFPAEELPGLATCLKKTPLTTLVLDECDLEPKSLLSILRTPARLKNLTLGENVFNGNRSRSIKPKLSNNASASLEALSAVAHSLESLIHFDPGWRLGIISHKLYGARRAGDGLRNFHVLKYLECETNSFLHQVAVMNRDLAPPNLETLRLRRHWAAGLDFFDQPPEVDPYLALPSLSTLELMQSSYYLVDLSLPNYICQVDRLRNRHASAYKLFKTGINLKVLIEMHASPSLIPPYLRDERVPIVQCLYDASVVGFRRHIIEAVDLIGRKEEAGPPSSCTAVADAGDSIGSQDLELPETDQLGDDDIQRLTRETSRALRELKLKLSQGRKLVDFMYFSGDESDTDADYLDEEDDFDFEVDDLDEDEDMELELELDGDLLEGGNEGDGHLHIEVYESETDEEDGSESEEQHGELAPVEGVYHVNDDLD